MLKAKGHWNGYWLEADGLEVHRLPAFFDGVDGEDCFARGGDLDYAEGDRFELGIIAGGRGDAMDGLGTEGDVEDGVAGPAIS